MATTKTYSRDVVQISSVHFPATFLNSAFISHHQCRLTNGLWSEWPKMRARVQWSLQLCRHAPSKEPKCLRGGRPSVAWTWMSFKTVTGISQGETPRARCEGASSVTRTQPRSCTIEPSNTFQCSPHTSWSPSKGFSITSWWRAHIQLKRVLFGIFPRWILVWWDTSSRSSWPRPVLCFALQRSTREKGSHLGTWRTQNTVHRKDDGRIPQCSSRHATSPLAYPSEQMAFFCSPRSPSPVLGLINQSCMACICEGYSFRKPLDCLDI